MFTGIIETIGEVVGLWQEKDIFNVMVRSDISAELRPEQSVAHDGVCLTVVYVEKDKHAVQLVTETLRRSHFKDLVTGTRINLERSMPASGRFEGHLVQGHVDGVGRLISIEDGIYTFQYPDQYAKFLVEKGSICVNGVSLTVAALQQDTFGVAVIPYTLQHTNLSQLKPGMMVNLEFDILAKHLARILELRGS